MTPSADPGVSIRSRSPHPFRPRKFLQSNAPPCTPRGVAGVQLGTWEDQDRGGGGTAPNLPRGAGLDWRADPPRGLGARWELGWRWWKRWEPRCGGDIPQLAENVLGAQWMEVSGLRRGLEGGRAGEGCLGGTGENHPARQAQLGADEATGLGCLPMFPRWGEDPRGA